MLSAIIMLACRLKIQTASVVRYALGSSIIKPLQASLIRILQRYNTESAFVWSAGGTLGHSGHLIRCVDVFLRGARAHTTRRPAKQSSGEKTVNILSTIARLARTRPSESLDCVGRSSDSLAFVCSKGRRLHLNRKVWEGFQRNRDRLGPPRST